MAFVAEEQATNDSGPELGAAAATSRGSTLKVMINGKIRANIDVDTMASRSCMTSGILDDMKLLTPIATQTLITAVTFTLGDNSEVSCTEIAYVDMAIHTHEDKINIKGVPVFILHGPPGGDILFGVSEQRTIGLATPQELMASRSREISDVTAHDPLTKNSDLFSTAGSEVLKMLKVRLIDTIEAEEI